jgi:hypothetical protein
MEKRPSKEQMATFKKNANDMSLSAEVRAKFQAIVDKFENVGEAVVDAVEGKKERKPRTPKATTERKPRATRQTADDVAMAKAEIKKRTGKTEEECEKIVEEYRSLRNKSQERKKKETEASKTNVARINKLKDDNKVIEGTNEKTADAVIESTTKDVAEKIEKQIEIIEKKAETEAKREVEKQMPKVSATEKKQAVKEKVEEKVKEKTKTIVKRVVIDTSALLTSIAESLGKFDKDSQKEFLIKLRSDIDKLISKYSFGGMTDGATQIMNIQQSNLSSSSVNPTMFGGGGGVGDFSKEVGKDLIQNYDMSASDVRNLLMDYYDEIKDMKRRGKNSSEVADNIAKLDGESYLEEEYDESDEFDNGGGVEGMGVIEKFFELDNKYSKNATKGELVYVHKQYRNDKLFLQRILSKDNVLKSIERDIDKRNPIIKIIPQKIDDSGYMKLNLKEFNGDILEITYNESNVKDIYEKVQVYGNGGGVGEHYRSYKIYYSDVDEDGNLIYVGRSDITAKSKMDAQIKFKKTRPLSIIDSVNELDKIVLMGSQLDKMTEQDLINAMQNDKQNYQIYKMQLLKINPYAKGFANGGGVGGRQKDTYNKLVASRDNEFYFVDYIFNDADGFKGATGTIVTPVSKEYYDYATSEQGILERYMDAMGEDEWLEALGLDREDFEDEDEMIKAIEDGIYDLYRVGELNPFEEVNYDLEEQMRKLTEFSDSDEFPLFEVIGGGRSFRKDSNFDKIYDQELYNKIRKVEEFKRGGNVNTGRSWKLDRARQNKNEKYELPLSSRKKAHGGTIEERMRMRRGM